MYPQVTERHRNMPQAPQLVLQDQIPADLTFDPRSASFKETKWECSDYSATYAGRPTLTLNQSLNKAKEHRFSEIRLVVPVETTDSTTGETSVEDVERAYVRFTNPTGVVDSEHDRLYTVLMDLLGTASVKSAIVNGDSFY